MTEKLEYLENDVSNWSIKDLLEIFEDPKKLTELDSKSDALISKALKQGKNSLADFLEKGANKLRRDHFDKAMGIAEFDNNLSGQAKQFITQQTPGMYGAGRERAEAYRILDDGIPRLVPNKLKISQSTEYKSTYQQGYVNPNFVQSYTRTVILNSMFRPNSIPYIPGDVYGPSSATNYHATLSEPLKMTTSLKLQSVSIPRIWDNIGCALGNSVLGIVEVNGEQDSNISQEMIRWYYIEDGVYNPAQLHGTKLKNIAHPETDCFTISLKYSNSNQTENTDDTTPSINVSSEGVVISGSGVQTQNNLENALVELTRDNSSNNENEEHQFRIVMFTSSMPRCNVESGKCYNTSSASRNLASTLGFVAAKTIRENSYSPIILTKLYSQSKFTAKVPPDLIGIRYLIIALDDFNVNKATNAIVGIADPNSKVAPKKSPFMARLPVSSLSATGDSFTLPRCQFVESNPRSRTQKQIFAENTKLIDSLKPETASVNPSIPNMISVCPITPGIYGSLLTLTGTAVNSTERTYFGPVKIEKMRVTLYDESGRIVDLKGHNWSITLTAEQLYQY